jgi:hypothetical protein
MNAAAKPAPAEPVQRLLAERAGVEPHRARHLDLAEHDLATPDGAVAVTINAAESPLAWLARRAGRDGRRLIEPAQLLAGERLRAEFTRAQMMPRITANWDAAVADRDRAPSEINATDAVIGARQRVRHALDAAGPEFAGLLVDVCCFLKALTQVETERGWPPRSAKVVLQLGLDRLARHYGLTRVARGALHPELRIWLAEDAAFVVGGDE